MDNIINIFKKRKIFYGSILILAILMVVFKYISNSFSMLQPIKSVEITSQNVSYQNNEQGAWKVTKSAKWTSAGKARITIDVDTILKTEGNQYKDIIMVLDISGSMSGEKLDRVKSDSIELINNVLSNSNNKMALISFETSSTILSDLTNDKDTLVNLVNDLSSTGNTNYYRALLNVEEIFKNYTIQSNRECIVMFLTDGYPNEDTPNQIGEYSFLKDTYPYVTFNGIQYEMGNTVLEPIKEISDNQWIASMDTLNNVLFDASVSPITYDEFTFIDYIDTNYFNIVSVDNIKSKIGIASLDGNKVTWTIKDGLKSGDSANLTIDVTLKEEFLNVGGTYPTNSSETITSKIKDNNEDVTSNLTPILSDKYIVTYDGNAPLGCTVSGVPNDETRLVFTNVLISDTKPTCSGYSFKKWEIVTDNVTRINDDYFMMPESDVTLRAVWSKLTLTKSVDGKVSKVQTLYNIMRDQAVMDNIQSEYVSTSTGIDFTSNNSNTNGKGVYERAGTENDTNPIYYYRGDIDDNNVIFADMCWKMVITTETGGVKMIYNGVPVDGKCNNTGTNTQIGTKAFNFNYQSPADVGYMYGTRYAFSSKTNMNNWYILAGKSTSTQTILTRKTSMESTNYYYGDKITWDETNSQYVLENSDGSTVTASTWSSNYSNLVGKYSCFSTATSCVSINYIGGATSSYAYHLTLTNGNGISNYRYISNDISYNSNTSTYTLNNPINVASTWYTSYYRYKGYYFCSDLNSTTCSTIYYINSNTNYQATTVSMTNGETYDTLSNAELLFGNSVDTSGNLQDTISIKTSEWSTKYNTLSNNHYTCFSTSSTCSTIYYVYYTFSNDAYYITLPIGKTVSDALSEMLDYNTTSSTIKGSSANTGTIDYWYYNNIDQVNDTNENSYSDYIEDTVYCNDRSYNNYETSGWNPDGGDTTKYLYYGAYGRSSNPSVTCPRNVDKFTVSSTIGNGALDYPVGLLSEDEIRLAGGASSSNYTYYLWNGTPGTTTSSTATYWWSASPYNFLYDRAGVNNVRDDGYLFAYRVRGSYGVRPVVSLRTWVRTSGGDGTRDDPYTIEVRELG